MAKQVWFKNNKAAEKFSASDIEKIFEDVLNWLKIHKDTIYVGEVDEYLMVEHSVVPSTRKSWIANIHKDNKSIVSLWTLIIQQIENRVVKDKEQLRPTIQAMVLQNKHDYREKHDHNLGGQPDNPFQVQEVEAMTVEEQLRVLNEKLHRGKTK